MKSTGMLALLGVGLAAIVSVGCSQPHRMDPVVVEPTVSPRRTAESQIRAICTELVGDRARSLVIEIDPDPTPRAFCHPPDRLTVTQGLLNHLPEAELAAAVAHELAHLTSGQPLAVSPGLDGMSGVVDEAAADRTAVRLLRQAGYDDHALQRLLARLIQDPAVAPAARQGLMHRFAQLTGS